MSNEFNSASEPRLYLCDHVHDDKERYRVYVAMWLLSVLIHIGLAYGFGLVFDWWFAEYEVKIAWSDELNGFGMMGDIFNEVEYDDTSEILDEMEAPEEDENPFEEPNEDVTPDMDASSIEAPPEPDPEPSDEVEATEPVEDKPKYDLSRDKAKLAAVRQDVAGMPNLHVLAPGNAKLIVLLRNDRILGSRFEQSVRRLFKSFPDYQFTLGKSNVDPVTDIDAMLIATANPELYAETFLVVSHRIPVPTLKQAIVASFPTEIKWETYNDKPIANPNSHDGRYNPRSGIYKRSVYLPDDHTILFLKPEVLPTLNVPHVDAIVSTRNEDVDSAEEAQSFLQSLGAIQTSDSPSMPMLFMALQGIEEVNFGAKMPKFDAPSFIQASLSTDANPHLNMVATFADADQAKAFNDAWPKIVSGASSLGIPGLGGVLGGLALTPEDNQVLVAGDLNGNMISLILMFASTQLQKNN